MTVALAACATTAAAPNSSAPVDGGILRVGVPSPTASPEPVTMYDPGSIDVVQQVAEYLIWSENDGELSPVLAQRWEASEDASTWTVELRDGVTFNDGSAFDAEDVIASIDRITAPDSVSAGASAFEGILAHGAATALGDTSVIFELSRPYADFPYLISSANYNTVILPSEYSGDFLNAPVGTGPFLLDSFDTSSGASFSRNPDYWNADGVHLDGVEMTFFGDPGAQTAALLSGTIDVAVGIYYETNKPLFDNPGITIESTVSSGGSFIAMRTETAPWDDVRVREAFALSIDREELLVALQGGQGDVANDHIFAPVYGQDIDLPQRGKDDEKARALLAKAGYPDGLEVTLSAPSSAAAMAQLVQQMAKSSGFTITLDLQDSSIHYDSAWLNAPMSLSSWAARPTASEFLSLAFTSDAVWNAAHWENPEFDAVVEEYQSTVDPAARAEFAQQIATIMHDEVPQVITAWPQNTVAMLPKVSGVPVSASAYARISGAWLTE